MIRSTHLAQCSTIPFKSVNYITSEKGTYLPWKRSVSARETIRFTEGDLSLRIAVEAKATLP